MPAGAISSTTLASGTAGGAAESQFTAFAVDPGLLVTGSNVIAVEVHQAAANSSDISFNLSVAGNEVPAAPDTLAPDTPANLIATAAGASQIDLSWDASIDNGGGVVAGYNVFRDGNPVAIATVTTTSFSDTGLASNTLFSYSVTAFDNATPMNESLPTAAVMESTGAADVLAPDVPGNFTATPISDTQIDLSWDASVDNGGGVVAGYNIFRDGNPVAIATVTTTSFSDTGLASNTLFSYSVTAFDNAVPVNESGAAITNATTLVVPVAVSYLPAGSNWRYLDDGSDQGSAWQASGFDDSSWSTGSAGVRVWGWRRSHGGEFWTERGEQVCHDVLPPELHGSECERCSGSEHQSAAR